MSIPSTEDLLQAACHIGHPSSKWNPKMAPYLYGTQGKTHIFDLEKTREHLSTVCEALKDLRTKGKVILFVSTKQQSIPVIEEITHELKVPFVTHKWIGGLITNWQTVKKRIQYYQELQQSFKSGDIEKYTKKEQLKLRKELAKLDNAFRGVASMTAQPDALFIVDATRDSVALREAKKIGIPILGICDSNANPDDFTHCIPANDDAVKSIELLLYTVKDEMLSVEEDKGATKKSGKSTAATDSSPRPTSESLTEKILTNSVS